MDGKSLIKTRVCGLPRRSAEPRQTSRGNSYLWTISFRCGIHAALYEDDDRHRELITLIKSLTPNEVIWIEFEKLIPHTAKDGTIYLNLKDGFRLERPLK